MAGQQIGHRKLNLVLSAHFPIVNWCSRSVAKSAYCVYMSRQVSLLAEIPVAKPRFLYVGQPALSYKHNKNFKNKQGMSHYIKPYQ